MNKRSVFELFNILKSGDISKKDIIDNLQIKNSTFYKNVMKLKSSGFKIEHKKDIYNILIYQNVLKLDSQERSVLAYLLNISSTFLSKKKNAIFKNMINKFLLLTSYEQNCEVKEKYEKITQYRLYESFEEKIEELKKRISNKTPILIALRSKRALEILPVDLKLKNDKLNLYYKNLKNNEFESIPVEKIAKIVPPGEEEPKDTNDEVIYQIYGRLAAGYLLKQNERVVASHKGSLVIATSEKDKKVLFKRLLRYDTLCKVLFPKKDVEEFKKTIDKAIENIQNDTGK